MPSIDSRSCNAASFANLYLPGCSGTRSATSWRKPSQSGDAGGEQA
jgi:hypothetical protein